MSDRTYRWSDGSTRDYPQMMSIGEDAFEEHLESERFEILNKLGTKQGGTKHDGSKPRTELIPTEFTIEVAKALTFGANKYSEDNFKNGISYRRLLGAAKRHIELELCKIDSDQESSLSHLAHAGASLAMYAFMKTHRSDLDDRYEYTEEQKKKIEEMMYGEKK